LHTAIKLDEHYPYTKSDVMCLISRIHEVWGDLLNDKYQKKLAKETYARAYELREDFDKKVSADKFFTGYKLFLDIAVSASTVDHNVWAAEFYRLAVGLHEEGVKKQKKSVNVKKNELQDLKNREIGGKMYFGLAKCLCKSGQMTEAIEAVQKALLREPAKEQLLSTLNAWENPLQRLEHDLTMPTEDLLDNYLQSNLKNLMR